MLFKDIARKYLLAGKDSWPNHLWFKRYIQNITLYGKTHYNVMTLKLMKQSKIQKLVNIWIVEHSFSVKCKILALCPQEVIILAGVTFVQCKCNLIQKCYWRFLQVFSVVQRIKLHALKSKQPDNHCLKSEMFFK